MAELRRNQKGEMGRQQVNEHCWSHLSLRFDRTSPTQTNDGTSQIDRHIGAHVPYSFRTMSRVLLRPLPTGERGLFTASMISAVFLKTLVDGPAGV